MNATVTETQIKIYGEPVWELAWLFPAQGHWSEEEYLSLETNRATEYSHGRIEVLPMPTPKHQRIIAHLFLILHALNLYFAHYQLNKETGGGQVAGWS